MLSRISVYFFISKLMLLFSYSYHVPCIILSNVYFYIVRSMFPFLFNWSQSKASVVTQMTHLFFESQKYCFALFNFFENGHIHNVRLTLFNVLNFNIDIVNVVSTLIWHRLKSRRHVLLKTTLRPRWKVSWVLTNVAKRLYSFVKLIKLKIYLFSRIPLNCCFRKLSKRHW